MEIQRQTQIFPVDKAYTESLPNLYVIVWSFFQIVFLSWDLKQNLKQQVLIKFFVLTVLKENEPSLQFITSYTKCPFSISGNSPIFPFKLILSKEILSLSIPTCIFFETNFGLWM